MFAIAALRFGWRHGERAALAVTPTEAVDTRLKEFPAQEPPLTVPPPEAKPEDKLTPVTAAFYIEADGEMRYKGSSGGEARRVIEELRTRDVAWTASRQGEPWDWGPR